MALYEGLVEYDPKTMESNSSFSRALGRKQRFHPSLSFICARMRAGSNGEPINASDVVYSSVAR